MSGFNVTLRDGTIVNVTEDESLEDILIELGYELENIEDILLKTDDEVENIFGDIDNGNGTSNTNEREQLKARFIENNYEVKLAEDGLTPRKAYNNAIQNMRNRYDYDNLKEYYRIDETDLYEVKNGDNLWSIAKKTLEMEGLPTDNKSINDRIAQIANLNDINNVNLIRIGQKLIYKLTETGIQKVKDADNNSATAFGRETGNVNLAAVDAGEAVVVKGSESTTKESPDGVNTGFGVTAESEGNGVADNVVIAAGAVGYPSVMEGCESTITVSLNGLNMGSGVPVDRNGNELKTVDGANNFADPKFKEGGGIMKYTSGDTVMYQITYKEDGSLSSGVKLTASSIEKLLKLRQNFIAVKNKVRSVQNASDAGAASIKAENLAALKELVTISCGNIQVIRNVIEKLRVNNYVDRTSDDYKAFVQDILLTKNADVVRALLFDASGKPISNVLTNDKIAHEMVAVMCQEIRRKEKAGEKLSDVEINLKNVVANFMDQGGYYIEADTEKNIHKKWMSYDNMDGIPMYQTKVGDHWYYAKDSVLLDEFLTKLGAADSDDKKAALFKEYIKTADSELAKCLAENVKNLCAADEDIISLVNANGMEVIDKIPVDNGEKYSEEVVVAVAEQMREIYTADKGNLENAVYLSNLVWIDKTNMSDDSKLETKIEILETYFEVTQDAEENKTYTFNPSRRPTYEEMAGLAVNYLSDDMYNALVEYIKLDDTGKGQYNQALEDETYSDNISSSLRSHYTELIDNMTTREEIIDFIDNKITEKPNSRCLPFDKILEKFPTDDVVKQRLLKKVHAGSYISDTNRLALAKLCMKDDGNGNLRYDKSKYYGRSGESFIKYVLPQECKGGNAKVYFDAALKDLDKNKLAEITKYKSKNPDSVKARIEELIEENRDDNALIQKVLELDSALIPVDILLKIDAAKAKWDDKTKAAVFERTFNNRVPFDNRLQCLEQAENNHLITKLAADRYSIGENLYVTDWYYDSGLIGLIKLPKSGYDNGIAMYKELKGVGSGNIAKMLRGNEEEGYENYVTPDNVVALLQGVKDMSPSEGIMEYIANEWSISPGVKPGKALCNRIPKVLMRKAAEIGLNYTEEYKQLQKFFDADENFNFKKNDEASERYDSGTAKQLDELIRKLASRVLQKM